MKAPSQDIAQIIQDASLHTFGTDLFSNAQPSKPNECVSIYDTGGDSPEARYVYDRPTVQIRVRNNGYAEAYATIAAIRAAVHGKNNLTVNGTRYIQILQQGDIIYVGTDDQERSELTLNFLIHRTA
jgi:hypothetical protein